MYTIGQLSKKTGVTVRTLDYYDEIGLIKPSSKTEGGHRLYMDNDVMTLERVLALKYMGFSLEKMKDVLNESTSTWQQSIQHQLEMVQREQDRLKTLEQALTGISYAIEFEGEINWSMIFGTIRLFQQAPEDALQQYKGYLSDEEMRKIMDINAGMSEDDIAEWTGIIHDIKNNLEIDPGSEKAQQLAERWMNQADNMFEQDEELLSDMWEALQNLKEGIAFYPMDQDVINFIERALTIKYAHREVKK
ncbi:MerR family transcriptional regulator [Lentibacillus salicampi]|uniref:MerR family transcriptional regulator n=1 Tax=Lentibacillus salicampi TaxID=175306 RepID=A0A4Y9A8A9_9BACI|nr:MerR family transcriptional regulator [Lentibacillus salicampi]TFJ92003.1 MerR family transcriptional regulator [Lentibacillus salicampi]